MRNCIQNVHKIQRKSINLVNFPWSCFGYLVIILFVVCCRCTAFVLLFFALLLPCFYPAFALMTPGLNYRLLVLTSIVTTKQLTLSSRSRPLPHRTLEPTVKPCGALSGLKLIGVPLSLTLVSVVEEVGAAEGGCCCNCGNCVRRLFSKHIR